MALPNSVRAVQPDLFPEN
jgi:hypothetical protein